MKKYVLEIKLIAKLQAIEEKDLKLLQHYCIFIFSAINTWQWFATHTATGSRHL